jgi:hypothetical protein
MVKGIGRVGPKSNSFRLTTNVRFGSLADILQCNRHVRLATKADIGCVLDYRSVGDAAVTTTPVYARDTDWSCRIGGEHRCLPLAKASPRTYARPALRKAFAAFAADSKVA